MSVRHSVRPSVCLSPLRPGTQPSPGEIETSFSPYDSVEFLVFLRPNFVPLGEEIFLKRVNQRGVPAKKSLFYRY